jgi:hypothetical protein
VNALQQAALTELVDVLADGLGRHLEQRGEVIDVDASALARPGQDIGLAGSHLEKFDFFHFGSQLRDAPATSDWQRNFPSYPCE